VSGRLGYKAGAVGQGKSKEKKKKRRREGKWEK
jgi:hypothetical protein